jgi:hypothetical protein
MSTPGAGLPRLAGGVLWNQLTTASSMGAASAFLGMFDEVSEGTQILKVTDSPPTQSPYTVTYEGMPSDAYLCFASQGSQMLKGKLPPTTALPGCPGLTQPTIPDPIAPLDGAMVAAPTVSLSWTAALALAGGGSLTTYDTWLDGTVQSTSSLALGATASLAPGTHVWRVRAVNSLGNSGGWSIAQTFQVTSSSADGGAVPDGGAGTDAAAPTDASVSSDAHAGAGADGGTSGASPSPASSSSGCACAVSPGDTTVPDGLPWAALAWLAYARRRSASVRA